MPSGYGFKDKRIAETLKQIAKERRSPGVTARDLELRLGPEGRVRISNAAGVGIPGAGLCYADSEEYDPDAGEHLFTNVKRPTSTQHANKLIVYIGDFARTLQPEASDSDGYSWGSRLIYPEWVYASNPGVAVTPGELWGPQPNSFAAKKGSSGLITTGASYTDPDTGRFYIRAYQSPTVTEAYLWANCAEGPYLLGQNIKFNTVHDLDTPAHMWMQNFESQPFGGYDPLLPSVPGRYLYDLSYTGHLDGAGAFNIPVDGRIDLMPYRVESDGSTEHLLGGYADLPMNFLKFSDSGSNTHFFWGTGRLRGYVNLDEGEGLRIKVYGIDTDGNMPNPAFAPGGHLIMQRVGDLL